MITEFLCGRSFTVRKNRESFGHRHQKGDRECPPRQSYQGLMDFYQTHSHNIHLKLTRLELTIERSYQTHSHNICLKITRLVRRYLRRKNMSSSKKHCCYIIFSTELKEKQRLKHLLTMLETRVQSLGREDTLEKEMATHSSTLAWKIP